MRSHGRYSTQTLQTELYGFGELVEYGLEVQTSKRLLFATQADYTKRLLSGDTQGRA